MPQADDNTVYLEFNISIDSQKFKRTLVLATIIGKKLSVALFYYNLHTEQESLFNICSISYGGRIVKNFAPI